MDLILEGPTMTISGTENFTTGARLHLARNIQATTEGKAPME